MKKSDKQRYAIMKSSPMFMHANYACQELMLRHYPIYFMLAIFIESHIHSSFFKSEANIHM